MSARARHRPWFRVQPEHYERACADFATQRLAEQEREAETRYRAIGEREQRALAFDRD